MLSFSKCALLPLQSRREEVDKELLDESEPLPPHAATEYRALAARLNYLALDRPDLQFATKEIARHMAAPTVARWAQVRPASARRDQ